MHYAKIASIRCDHGGEFENKDFESICEEHGIEHNFSAPRTPQQNGVVERKNRSLEEIARSFMKRVLLSQGQSMEVTSLRKLG